MEAVGQEFALEGLLAARARSWQALRLISQRIEVGFTEKQALKVAQNTLRELGAARFWHRSIIRFAQNTLLTFSKVSADDPTLAPGDIYFIDLGPVWKFPEISPLEYEGDVGDTFVAGETRDENAEARRNCAAAARDLFRRAADQWRNQRTTGVALYDWLEREARSLGYVLNLGSDGHRVADFPHKLYSSRGLLDVDFTPAPNLWILEVQIADPAGRFGAFFEDLLV